MVIEKITALIEPVLQSMGYRLVRVRLSGSNKKPTLQIMAEHLENKAALTANADLTTALAIKPMGIEDCTKISREISVLLDVHDPIANSYRLEVSSPGLDRPLITLTDFAKAIAPELLVNIILKQPIEPAKTGNNQFGQEIRQKNILAVIRKIDDKNANPQIWLQIIDNATQYNESHRLKKPQQKKLEFDMIKTPYPLTQEFTVIQFDNIASAQLVLNNDLLAKADNGQLSCYGIAARIVKPKI